MDPAIQFQEQFNSMNELNTRTRILEGKHNMTRERMLLINQNMIDHYKTLSSQMKIINDEIREIKETMETIRETSKNLIGEMSFFARKDQLKILEKYINMWNPLNFVTKEEVIELLEKKGGKHGTTRNKRK